jgi:flagella basal body P-ring formation protein FlgA
MRLVLYILLCFLNVQANSFDSQLKSYLDEKLKNFEKYEYQIIRAPKGYSKIEINDEKNFRLSKNYAYVPVRILDANRAESFSLLTVRVKLYRTVLVTNEKIERGQILSPLQFEKKLIDVSELEGRIAENEIVSISRSKVMINDRTVLLKEMIEPIPIINSGDKVILHSGRNGVDITVDAVSRQDGCVGDVISVQSNSKIYKAKVIDKFNLTLVE